MSMDNGHVIRQNAAGEYCLQMYFASDDNLPSVEKTRSKDRFPTLDAAARYYGILEQDAKNVGCPLDEYGLSIRVEQQATGYNDKVEPATGYHEVNLDDVVRDFVSKPYEVKAIRVTEDNMDRVSAWCGGVVKWQNEKVWVQVPVKNPQHERHTRAYVGDWVVKSERGWKVYNNRAFRRQFDSVGPSLGTIKKAGYAISVTSRKDDYVLVNS